VSLHPRPDFAIPDETRRVAHAAFPKGITCLCIAEELGPLYRDDQFAGLLLTCGQPAASPPGSPWPPSSNTSRDSPTARPPMPSAAASTGSAP
jgi:hypothetical protein